MMFEEFAEKAHHSTLKNKSAPKETRWIRSDLRASNTFRNSPTFYNIYDEKGLDFSREANLTSQKVVEKK